MSAHAEFVSLLSVTSCELPVQSRHDNRLKTDHCENLHGVTTADHPTFIEATFDWQKTFSDAQPAAICAGAHMRHPLAFMLAKALKIWYLNLIAVPRVKTMRGNLWAVTMRFPATPSARRVSADDEFCDCASWRQNRNKLAALEHGVYIKTVCEMAAEFLIIAAYLGATQIRRKNIVNRRRQVAFDESRLLPTSLKCVLAKAGAENRG